MSAAPNGFRPHDEQARSPCLRKIRRFGAWRNFLFRTPGAMMLTFARILIFIVQQGSRCAVRTSGGLSASARPLEVTGVVATVNRQHRVNKSLRPPVSRIRPQPTLLGLLEGLDHGSGTCLRASAFNHSRRISNVMANPRLRTVPLAFVHISSLRAAPRKSCPDQVNPRTTISLP